MAKFSLEKLQEMCRLNLDKKHVQEILVALIESEFRFHPGVIQPQSQIASLYKLRLGIAKDSGRCDFDFLDDYERAVFNLQNSSSTSIGITALFVQENGFIIFYEPESRMILGVLKGNVGI